MNSHWKSRVDFTRRRNSRRRSQCLFRRRRALTFEPIVFLSKRVWPSALVSFRFAWLKRLLRLRRQTTRQRSICVWNLLQGSQADCPSLVTLAEAAPTTHPDCSSPANNALEARCTPASVARAMSLSLPSWASVGLEVDSVEFLTSVCD